MGLMSMSQQVRTLSRRTSSAGSASVSGIVPAWSPPSSFVQPVPLIEQVPGLPLAPVADGSLSRWNETNTTVQNILRNRPGDNSSPEAMAAPILGIAGGVVAIVVVGGIALLACHVFDEAERKSCNAGCKNAKCVRANCAFVGLCCSFVCPTGMTSHNPIFGSEE